jgi:hypothetical protein
VGTDEPPTGAVKKQIFYISLHEAITKQAQMSSKEALSFMQTWNMITVQYRSLGLTKPKERVMAFAGLAQAMHKITRLKYLARLWDGYLPFCLMWYNSKPGSFSVEPIMKEFTEPAVNAVPTWSWFAVPIAKGERISNATFDILDTHSYSTNLDNKETTDIYQAILKAISRQKDCLLEPASLDWYHDFKGLSVTMNLSISRFIYAGDKRLVL